MMAEVATAVQAIVTDGGAIGCRALDVRVWDGIDVRILPDRGFDIGAAWYRGAPIAWTSAVGEVGPLPSPRGDEWEQAWPGGLVSTCGLHNVGEPSEGYGLHGTVAHRPARDVRVERRDEDERVVVEARARVVDGGALAGVLVLDRSISTSTGVGRLELVDTVSNPGSVPLPAPLLYHVNFGAPLWAADSFVTIGGGEPKRAPEAIAGGAEEVQEHRLVADANGWAHAVITSPATGLRVEVSWDADTLDRVHQWVHPAPEVWALAIEPANCSVAGRASDRAEGRLPMLAGGETRTTRLRIEVEKE